MTNNTANIAIILMNNNQQNNQQQNQEQNQGSTSLAV